MGFDANEIEVYSIEVRDADTFSKREGIKCFNVAASMTDSQLYEYLHKSAANINTALKELAARLDCDVKTAIEMIELDYS